MRWCNVDSIISTNAFKSKLGAPAVSLRLCQFRCCIAVTVSPYYLQARRICQHHMLLALLRKDPQHFFFTTIQNILLSLYSTYLFHLNKLILSESFHESTFSAFNNVPPNLQSLRNHSVTTDYFCPGSVLFVCSQTEKILTVIFNIDNVDVPPCPTQRNPISSSHYMDFFSLFRHTDGSDTDGAQLGFSQHIFGGLSCCSWICSLAHDCKEASCRLGLRGSTTESFGAGEALCELKRKLNNSRSFLQGTKRRRQHKGTATSQQAGKRKQEPHCMESDCCCCYCTLLWNLSPCCVRGTSAKLPRGEARGDQSFDTVQPVYSVKWGQPTNPGHTPSLRVLQATGSIRIFSLPLSLCLILLLKSQIFASADELKRVLNWHVK